jgi:hypothetical protein
MRRRALAILGWTVVALCLWPWQAAGRQQDRRSSADSNPNHKPNVVQGLLGPVAGLAASAEWVRFDWYVREGRLERAYAAAERALALEPRATQGWIHLASHLAFGRASLESEPQSLPRLRWIRAGLALLEQGEQQAAVPADLAYLRGLILAWVADLEDLGSPAAPGWPGGSDGARLAAADAFHSAGEAGNLEGYLMEGILRTGKHLEPPGDDREN